MSVANQAGAPLPHEQRLGNAVACLTTLRDSPTPLTISQLATRTGLSRPTVDAVLRDLTETSPVVDDDQPRSSGVGRPARRFGFDAAAGCVAGVDVGVHSTRVVLSDLAGTVISRSETEVRAGLRARSHLTAVRKAITAAVADSPTGPLRAVGMGVPGILDPDQRISHSLALPEWVGLAVRDEMATALDAPVIIDNDIKLAALAEHRLRADAPDDLVFLQIGNRISLALVVGGEVLQGSHRIAGELGTLRGMRWTASSERGQLRWRTAETAEEVLALAADGDAEARAEVAEFCTEIAPGIATILLTVDPELVVIGGGLSRAGATFLDPLTDAVHHLLTIDARPALSPSLLRSRGPSCGAIGLAFDQLSTEVLGVPGVPPPWQRWLEYETSQTTDSQPHKETS